MYYSTLVVLIGKLDLLVVGFPSSDLYTWEDFDEPLEHAISWMPEEENLDLSSESIIIDSGDQFFTEDFHDDTNIDEILWTNLAYQSPCVISQTDEFTLFTRDGDSCRAKEEEEPMDLPSEASLQLWRNPMEALEKLLPQEDESSGSSEPPEPIKPFYPGHLSDDEVRAKEQIPGALFWDLDLMPGMEHVPPRTPEELRSRECRSSRFPFPVCCNDLSARDPARSYLGLEDCDLGTFIIKTPFADVALIPWFPESLIDLHHQEMVLGISGVTKDILAVVNNT
jgi:hypothetical protein